MVIGKHEAVQADKLGGNGEGKAQLMSWLGDAEMCPNLSLLTTITLDPGATVSDHPHHGEAEIYRPTQGSGEYNDNGKYRPVKAGDITFTPDNHGHGLANTGNTDLVFMALIIKD